MSIVSGKAPSRLSELKKYRQNGSLSDRYVTGGDVNTDGVSVSESDEPNRINYWLGGINYRDFFNPDTGKYIETRYDFNRENFEYDIDDVNLVKDFNKGNVINKPEVDVDVFIERQSQSIFEGQYRLRAVSNLSQLNFYGGGNYFNIINNI